jgi:hypothetical protein
MYLSSVSVISKICCSFFLIDVAKVDQGMLHMLQMFQKHVASVCSKCFICFQIYVAIVFYLDVAYVFTHMLQQYVPNVSAVSVLCCNKCFFMLQLFIQMLHIFHTHVANVCPKCFICSKCMLHSSVSCCKCRSSALVSPEDGQGQARATDAWRRCRPPLAV